MSSKIITVLLIFCFFNRLKCEIPSEEEFNNSEFTKALLGLANIFENKTDVTYGETVKLLNSPAVDIKSQCRMNRNLYYLDLKEKEYEKVFERILRTNLKSRYDALDLWNNLEAFFQEMINCYPAPQTFWFSSIKNVSYNAMAIIAQEIVKRCHFFIKHGRHLQSGTLKECLLRQDVRKRLFFQELLRDMSPLSGSCDVHIEQRKCVMKKVENLSQDIQKDIKILISPIGSDSICKYL